MRALHSLTHGEPHRGSARQSENTAACGLPGDFLPQTPGRLGISLHRRGGKTLRDGSLEDGLDRPGAWAHWKQKSDRARGNGNPEGNQGRQGEKWRQRPLFRRESPNRAMRLLPRRAQASWIPGVPSWGKTCEEVTPKNNQGRAGSSRRLLLPAEEEGTALSLWKMGSRGWQKK